MGCCLRGRNGYKNKQSKPDMEFKNKNKGFFPSPLLASLSLTLELVSCLEEGSLSLCYAFLCLLCWNVRYHIWQVSRLV